jgi:nucleotide-binding universal stress UspA family protein
MVETIVVPLDGSELAERALAPAGALARRRHAEVVVMSSVFGHRAAEPERYLAQAVDAHGLEGARLEVSDHGVVRGLADIVRDATDPVVCMTTHGRSGIGKALLGSTAEEILREVPAPMLLVGPAVDPEIAIRFDRVVVCTDGSETSQAIVSLVREWIRDLGLEPWVVQVVEPDTAPEVAAAGRDLDETAVVQGVATALSGDGGDVDWDVLHGTNVDAAIVDYAASLPASLIAMATHGRSGLARLALGSTTASVVQLAPCPVLVTRPTGLQRG